MSAKILFSTNQLPGSIAIRVGTWSRFSHCDLIVGNGSRIIGAAPFCGVAESPIEKRLESSRHWAIYEVETWQAPVEAAAREQLGKPYDWLGCLGIVFHRDWHKDSRWFCSELIAHAFSVAGVHLVNPELRLNRVTPEALLRSPLLKRIAEKPAI